MPSKNTTESNLYKRSLRASVVIGLLATLFTAVYAGPPVAVAYLTPLVWMLLNLLLWGRTTHEMLSRQRGSVLFFLITTKLLWLGVLVALAGPLGIGSDLRRLAAFLLGFNTPFLIMFLKAVGGVIADSLKERHREAADGSIIKGSLDR